MWWIRKPAFAEQAIVRSRIWIRFSRTASQSQRIPSRTIPAKVLLCPMWRRACLYSKSTVPIALSKVQCCCYGWSRDEELSPAGQWYRVPCTLALGKVYKLHDNNACSERTTCIMISQSMLKVTHRKTMSNWNVELKWRLGKGLVTPHNNLMMNLQEIWHITITMCQLLQSNHYTWGNVKGGAKIKEDALQL